jgi:Resolvase, N terminal domain
MMILAARGSSAASRRGFAELVADVGLGRAGIILSLEVSRLARNNTDWYQLLDLCALTDTPGGAPPAAVGDVAGLFDIDVHQLAWCGPLVAAHGPPAGPVQVR